MNKVDIGAALISYLGFLVALTMREAAQAFVARRLGDNSTDTQARATLNPIPHIDILGTVVFPVLLLTSGTPFLFGWAKPFIPDSRYFKRMRRDLNLVYASGPGFNFLLAILCGIAIKVGDLGAQGGLMQGEDPLPRIVFSIALANLVIGVLNLLPFPNTDGWKLLLNSVSYNASQKLQQLSTPIMIAALALLFLGGLTPIFRFALGMFLLIFG